MLALAGSPQETLDRALARLRASTVTLSRYACIETVERQYFQPQGGLEATDRLRLEVTLSAGREIYSWPGATRFDTRDVSDIIREGPIGTGSFGTHLLAIFDNPQTNFEFAGKTAEGRLEYRFSVPIEGSRYRIRSGGHSAPVSYQGSFWIAPDTLALDRLQFQAGDLPPAASIRGLAGDLAYTPAQPGGLPLPARGELRITYDSGRQTTNLTSFSACREYTAESELTFDTAPAAVAEAAPTGGRGAAVALPIGLPVTLALVTPVDSDTAAAGDPVDARVVQPVGRSGGDGPLIPAGATVHGRLTRVEHHLLPEPYFLLAFSFNRWDAAGVSHRFAAHAEPKPELVHRLGAIPADEGGGMRYWGAGDFLFPTAKDRWQLPAGYQMKWFTLATRGRF
jgi:hypothetical protein